MKRLTPALFKNFEENRWGTDSNSDISEIVERLLNEENNTSAINPNNNLESEKTAEILLSNKSKSEPSNLTIDNMLSLEFPIINQTNQLVSDPATGAISKIRPVESNTKKVLTTTINKTLNEGSEEKIHNLDYTTRSEPKAPEIGPEILDPFNDLIINNINEDKVPINTLDTPMIKNY